MIFGRVPFQGDDYNDTFDRIISQQVEFPEGTSMDVQNIIEDFLTKDPIKRPSIFEKIVAMSFFHGLNIDVKKKRTTSVFKK